jgi:dCMP deaminase
MTDKWYRRFMRLAREISTWSKDPSSRIGAVIVNEDRRILATGYNGFPAGIADDHRWHDKATKYPLVIHGEMNCILNALRSGVSVTGATLFVYGLPICGECAKMIAQSGISRVVLMDPNVPEKERWFKSWNETSKPIFLECGIEIVEMNFDLDEVV